MTGDFAWPDLPKISTPLSDLPKIGPHPYKIHFCPDLFLSNFCPKRVTGTIGDRMSATSAISKVISIQFWDFGTKMGPQRKKKNTNNLLG